jgi:hypothetical protein
MASQLAVCHACHRRVRSDATACPFCAAGLEPPVTGSGHPSPSPALAMLTFAAAGCAYGPPRKSPKTAAWTIPPRRRTGRIVSAPTRCREIDQR